MEILLITDSPSEGKILCAAITSQGHAPIWRVGFKDGRQALEQRLWDLDAVIFSAGSESLANMVLLADHLAWLKDQRGYHRKPHFIGIGNEIPNAVARRIQLAGGFVISGKADFAKLMAFLEIFESQANHEAYRPYVLLEHWHSGPQHLFCDEEEQLAGVSIGYIGPPIATDQTDSTAVLIDYLCRQRYPKSDADICNDIAESSFYMAQLKGHYLRKSAIKMLISRARERLAVSLAETHSGVTTHQLLMNVPGHTRKYKIDAVVRVIHRRRFFK